MRTARSLPYWGGVSVKGVSVREPPCEQTDACENISLPQTSFAGGNKANSKANCFL